jgi:hypothetical protein
MRNGTQFLLTLLAWAMFMIGGFSFLRFEGEQAPSARLAVQPTVATASYTGTKNLNRISGQQVIGMIQPALDGKYVLYIDGLRIDENTDLDTMDLRGVPDVNYQLSVTRSNERVTTIEAVR